MAFNAYIHIDTVEGESKDSEFTGQMEVLSYDVGVSQNIDEAASSSGSYTTGKADWTTFSFTKTVDSASPVLVKYCDGGTHVDKVVFSVNRAGTTKQKYLEIEFTNCLIKSVNLSGGGDGLPTESVSIKFGTYKYAYMTTSTIDGQTMGSNVAMRNLIEGN